MSLATDIAAAVVAELAAAPAGTFPEGFEAVLRVLPEFGLADLAQLRVSVVPRSVRITAASRSESWREISLDIGIQRKLGADLAAEVAALGELADRIVQYLERRPLSQAPQARWTSAAQEPLYAPVHLAEERVFTSVLTLTYRVRS